MKYFTIILLFTYTFVWGIIAEFLRFSVATAKLYLNEGEPLPGLTELLILDLSSQSLYCKYSVHLELFLVLFLIYIIIELFSKENPVTFLQRSFCYFLIITTMGIFLAFISLLIYQPIIEALKVDDNSLTTIMGSVIHFIFTASVAIIIILLIFKLYKKLRAKLEKSTAEDIKK